tara:strand:- start:3088 stop:3372 length:285 start_codon:yes stop_codon:yes gene_type:complete
MASKYTNRTWAIVPLADIEAADVVDEEMGASNIYIDSCLQTSKDTLRLSVDGTQALLKWEGETPEAFEEMQTYTHPEILKLLAGSDWTNSDEQP